MKIKSLMMIVSLPAIIFSCTPAENKTDTAVVETETVSTDMADTAAVVQTESKTTVINTEAVPAPVKTNFTKKYPKASNVEWMTYEPIEYDNIQYTPGDTIYYVKYYDNGMDYYSWYNENGDWIRSRSKFTGGSSKLPEAVNKVIAAEYPDYTISEIDKENDKDMEMYEIELDKGGSKAKLKVLPDGTVFKRKEK